jgi:N-acetylglucosaminyldiphosphoundecaprenol N-acetyl-beta-D-mannosaminyltransferase
MDTALSSAAQADTEYPTDTSLESISIVGTPVACATYDSALERIKAFARESQATAVCPCNTHILAEARHNPEFARVLARFDLVLPDGMPVVWALNFRGAGLKDPVAGPYFMRHVLRSTPRPWRHFFFGDSEECLVELRRVLVQLQPDIEIAGMLSPPFRPFTEADEASFADAINRADPDFVWVALPGVRMERWIIDNQARYRGGVFLAVGDAFMLLSGRRRFAPMWMQRMGLTWAYRLSKEPLRLGPRYLRYNSMFVSYWLWDALRAWAWQKVERRVTAFVDRGAEGGDRDRERDGGGVGQRGGPAARADAATTVRLASASAQRFSRGQGASGLRRREPSIAGR